VLERIAGLYESGIANVHRAVNFLGDESTRAFEGARESIARFIGAQPRETVFTANTTQAINLVCGSLSRAGRLKVLTTTQEHHSNLLPWTETGEVEFVPWSEGGTFELGALERELARKPDLFAVAAASNFLGTVQPVKEIVERCHGAGVRVLIDASQSIAHQPHDVRDIGCDYLVFSGHKIYGPSGIGVLYAQEELLEEMPAFFLGGNMVKEVHARSWVPNDLPHRFEAGTPNIEGAVGLGAAIEFLESLDWDRVAAHESALVQYAKRELAALRGVRVFGPKPRTPSAPLVSFQLKGLESSAVAKALSSRGNIIVRSGFLCAQPAHDQLSAGPSVRASFAIYNCKEEVDRMLEVIGSLLRVFLETTEANR
jgi:cysteine desulfurase/selenocysteine lyase